MDLCAPVCCILCTVFITIQYIGLYYPIASSSLHFLYIRCDYMSSHLHYLSLQASLWHFDETATPSDTCFTRVINYPLILWWIVILHNYVLLFSSALTLIQFISLPPDIERNYDFIVYSLSIGSLSVKLSKGRHRIKTRDRSPKWLFICLLSGLTLLWWLCKCVCVWEWVHVFSHISHVVSFVCVEIVFVCFLASMPGCVLYVYKYMGA